MNTRVLTINGGSSSIKFAIFEPGAGMERLLSGGIEGIGLAQGKFVAKGREPADNFSRPSTTPDHVAAVNLLMDWMEKRIERGSIAAVSHRVVHGGPKHWEPVRVTEEVLADLRQISPFDPEHLPEEILLIEAFQRHLSEVPQVACFDTAFHHDLPRVARLLPLPRRYESAGLRRYGFHGLSCTYVMEELARLAGREPAAGRVVICHLGNGASITAVHSGRSMDTSMAFTPAAGLPMSTRAGDL